MSALGRVVRAALVGSAVFLGFLYLARGAPEVFEATGQFSVDPPPADAAAAARTIERAVFDAGMLVRLAEVAKARGATAGLEVAAGIRIEPGDGGHFRASCQSEDPRIARSLCDIVLTAAVNLAPRELAATSEAQRHLVSRTELAVGVLREHPELAAGDPATAPSPDVVAHWTRAAADVRTADTDARAIAAKLGARISAPPSTSVPVVAIGTTLVTLGALGAGFAALATLFLELGFARAPAGLEPEYGAGGPGPISSWPPSSRSPRSGPSSFPPPPRTPAPSRPPAPSNLPGPFAPSPSAPPANGAPSPSARPAPTTILPRPPASPAADSAEAAVSYASTSLDSEQQPAPFVPAPRTTQMLGSPARLSSNPPPSSGGARTGPGAPTTRYSFVSTPPPVGGAPVQPHDASPDWQPDPELDPAPCRPLCRELFAFGVEHCFVIGITAVRGLERDKSEFAASLALALAATGHARVLLVDSNFEGPVQHRLMRAEMPPGTTFSRQLQEHMTRTGDDHWSVLRCKKSLHVLSDGPDATPGLILSRTFEECVRALRAYYDFIVMDGPSGGAESECRAFDGVIDGLIVVCTEETRKAIPATSRFFSTKRFSKAIRATR
jgi:Mrp family chromosome partitioning ATPase